MRQITLDKWAKLSEDKCLRHVFYLDWSEKKSKPVFHAQWLIDVPTGCNFIRKVKWRDMNIDVTVCAKLCLEHLKSPIVKWSECKLYHNVNLIKSHLQKCVRRQKPHHAVSSAKYFMQMDLIGFLRRITIIMIEDVGYQEFYSTLLWMMVACSIPSNKRNDVKNDGNGPFQMRYVHRQWILGLVYHICTIPEYDPPVFDLNWIQKFSFPNISSKKSELLCRIKNGKWQNSLLQSEIFKNVNGNLKIISLLYNLQFRKAFGGMKCDKIMLENKTYQWMERFFGYEHKYFNEKILKFNDFRNVKWKLERNMEPDDWEIAAADFHPCPQMIGWLSDEFSDLDPDIIKEVIWIKRSSINTRRWTYDDKCRNPYAYDFSNSKLTRLDCDVIWNRINLSVWKSSKYIIKNYA